MQTFHGIGTTADWVVMVVYFIVIMLFGSYFGRYTKNTSDFFFGGRRFSWWLITMSIVATGVGSHSFVKYSAKAPPAGEMPKVRTGTWQWVDEAIRILKIHSFLETCPLSGRT